MAEPNFIDEVAVDIKENPPEPEFPLGLVGDIARYVMQTSRYPNAPLALGSALATCSTLCARRIAGPTNTAPVLWLFMVGPTGVGKDRPLAVPKILLAAAGRDECIGPGDLASVQAVQSLLTEGEHVQLCCLDEFGTLLARLVADASNTNSSSITSALNASYSIGWNRYDGVKRARDPSLNAVAPHLGLLGVSTPMELFSIMSKGLVGNGFINRAVVVSADPKSQGRQEALPPDTVPAPLHGGLHKLAIWGGWPANGTDGQAVLRPMKRLGWGSGAEAAFLALENEMQLNASDERRYELQQRVAENAIRLASVIAAGRFSDTVDVIDVAWGERIARRSLQAVLAGMEKYAPQLDYAETVTAIHEALLAAEDNWISQRDINRRWGRSGKFGTLVPAALEQLQREGRIVPETRKPKNGGRDSSGWKLVD